MISFVERALSVDHFAQFFETAFWLSLDQLKTRVATKVVSD